MSYHIYNSDLLLDAELLAKSPDELHALWEDRKLSTSRLTEIEARRAAMASPIASDFQDPEIFVARKRAEKSLPRDPEAPGNLLDTVLKQAEERGAVMVKKEKKQ